MKKTLLLLAMLLNAPLQASQPSQEAIIRLPRGLSCSLGLYNVPQELLLLISTFVFGSKMTFLIAKKGTEQSLIYTEKEKSINHVLWIVPPGLDHPTKKLRTSQDIVIDEHFWVDKEDCLCLDSIERIDFNQLYKVTFFYDFCFIKPYKLPENREAICLTSNKSNKHKIISVSNATAYYSCFSLKNPWIQNYSYPHNDSNDHFYKLLQVESIAKEKLHMPSNIVLFSNHDNISYHVDEKRENSVKKIVSKKVENQEQVLSEAEEDEEEISIYD